MSVKCSVLGTGFKRPPGDVFEFDQLPRTGDYVKLPDAEGELLTYKVTRVQHAPLGTDPDYADPTTIFVSPED